MSKKKRPKRSKDKELTIGLITVLIGLVSVIIELITVLIEKLK